MPKSWLYRQYIKVRNNKLAATIAVGLHVRIIPLFSKQAELPPLTHADKRFPVTGFICDEMTWQNYSGQAASFFVVPRDWKKAFEAYKPTVLFCESAWVGIDRYKDCWRGQLYKSDRLMFDNRAELWRILAYCKEAGITTVFWNKEDPYYFDNPHYNFADTALHFDHILTTSQECIPRYRKLGQASVHLWTFGFSPQIFYPPKSVDVGAALCDRPLSEGMFAQKDNIAVFAGSWFADHPARCKDMEAVFDMVLERGIELQIYDRQQHSGNSKNKFPRKYQQYVRPAVEYTELGNIYRSAKYAININTVADSRTMFARRVYEAMACGCIIISNHSDGLRSMFGKNIWFSDEPFNHDAADIIAQENIRYVFENHTCEMRWEQLQNILQQDEYKV